MKILAISGSSRDKTTNYMLRKILELFGKDHESELILLRDLDVQACRNCKGCHESFKCVIDDDMRDVYKKLKNVDVMILGSPTYFDNVSGIMKNFMDRCLSFYFSQELKDKKVGLVSVGGFPELVKTNGKGECLWCQETGGCQTTVDRCLKSMEYFCQLVGMKVIGKVAAIHGAPEQKNDELKELAEKLLRNQLLI